MITTRRKRRARWTGEKMAGRYQVQFIPGGFYWWDPFSRELFTGVHQRLASPKVLEKLMPLTLRAIAAKKGEWV